MGHLGKGRLVGALLKRITPTGGQLPKPALVLCNFVGCNTYIKWFEHLAEFEGAPLSILDVPFLRAEEPSQEDVAYVVCQLRELTKQLEELTGQKFDYDKFREAVRCSAQVGEMWSRIKHLARRSPSPFDAYFDAITLMGPLYVYRARPEGVEFFALALREMEEKVSRGEGVYDQEKFRTGRFLANAADVMGVSLDEIGPLSLCGTAPVKITTVCTVFVESYILCYLAQGKKPEDILRGVHLAIAKRTVSLARRVALEPEVALTGGVARNTGMIKALEEVLGVKLQISEEAQFTGAIGAALFCSRKKWVNRLRQTSGGRPMRRVVGIDVGSGFTKAVILGEMPATDSLVVLGRRCNKTGVDLEKAARAARAAALREAGLEIAQIEYTATTGLGRSSINFRDVQVTEITAGARGARYFFPQAGSVLDIGSQTTRAITLGGDGKVRQFKTNDKCAAGSGSFIVRAAKYLQVPLEEVGQLALAGRNPQPISSICAVLAETEIINHVSADVSIEDIVRGIYDSLADRAALLLKRAGMAGELVFIGGVARQRGMVCALEDRIKTRVNVPEEAGYVCALGAALLGLKRLQALTDRPCQPGLREH